MSLRIYNTLTNEKEEFIPREPGKVGMYVCGPTTYNIIHLGNARPVIVFDMVRRYLEYKGFEVLFVQNFTDIDDKIINRAQEEKMDPLALAKKYINEYVKDTAALGVRPANIHPKVSEHLPEIINMIQKIMDNGYAYPLNGDVYFDLRKFTTYGKLSGRNLEDMRAGARVEVNEEKHDPMDFALWKSAKPGEPAWESPWGPGRPGWHIECSAMSYKYLGMGFDIHGGGFDLIFPHHENEIAQSEAFAGCSPFARFWMHNGFITINEEKMSKSLGNFFTVREILAKYPAEVVRFFILSTHYRSPLDFDDSKLEVNKKSLERLKNTLVTLENLLRSKKELALKGLTLSEQEQKLADFCDQTIKDFDEAMDDDFNTALAIAGLFDLAREVNSFVGTLGENLGDNAVAVLVKAQGTFSTLGEVLGLFTKGQEGQAEGLVDDLMDLIISIRQEARAKKDWPTSDKIRDQLGTLGIIMEDTSQGVRWKKK